jgi:putative PIN family toxin of toxin-antitoxin system
VSEISKETAAQLPRVVFDCNVFLQAAVSRTGPAFACLELAEAGVFILVVSGEILVEVREVLIRPDVQKKFPGLTSAVVTRFLLRLTQLSEHVSPVPATIKFDRDPKDEPYLNLAKAARASHLVTRDRDMLDIMTDTAADGPSLREALPGLQILDPAAFLRKMRNIA